MFTYDIWIVHPKNFVFFIILVKIHNPAKIQKIYTKQQKKKIYGRSHKNHPQRPESGATRQVR